MNKAQQITLLNEALRIFGAIPVEMKYSSSCDSGFKNVIAVVRALEQELQEQQVAQKDTNNV